MTKCSPGCGRPTHQGDQPIPEVGGASRAETTGHGAIWRKIVDAAFERFMRLGGLMGASDHETLLAAVPQCCQLLEEFLELASWIVFPARSGAQYKRNQADTMRLLLDSGFPMDFALEAVGSRPRGAPPRKRVLAVAALELWHDKGWSWARVTREVCNCGGAEHGYDCKERLRQQINDLRECLKKYGIEEPPRKAAGASSP